MELTRIMVRRTLTEAKAAWAGVTLDSSFARSRPLMATSSKERIPSRPFGSWDLPAIVEMQGDCEKAVWREGCGEESEP